MLVESAIFGSLIANQFAGFKDNAGARLFLLNIKDL
jgi:hypothetical protein